MMRLYLSLCLMLPFLSLAQPVRQPDAAQIRLKLKKLNFLGSVLYMAAHPDDENTNVIAWLSNERLATTAYLSLTRGDGGQNLIGPEIREELGLIRTHELLAARNIDGGQQFFTRAIDFGFSKSPEEAFSIWGRDAVLSDAVRVLRKFQPDVIITRFPPDARAGHGHHTASAIVAGEAFDLAARPDAFPDQLRTLNTWQVRRLYTNTGRWWNQTINEHSPGVITIDVGGYNPLLGKSYSEISALSSSQHKSQGWGRRGERGYRPEFLEYMKGERAEKDIFDGIDTTWNRVPGGAVVQSLVDRALAAFDPGQPAGTVPHLFEIRKAILNLPDGVWKERKLRETEQLIADCLGLFIEVRASHDQYAPGQRIHASVEMVNRAPLAVRIESIAAPAIGWDSTLSTTLEANKPLVANVPAHVPEGTGFSDPYWLSLPHGTGLYTVEDKSKIGMPQNDPAVMYSFGLRIAGQELVVRRPAIYKWVDPVKGELWRPLEIVPPVTVNLSEQVLVFSTGAPKQVTLLLRSAVDEKLSGTVQLQLPKGWKADPESVPFALSGRGAESAAVITVYPSAGEYHGEIRAVAHIAGETYDRSLRIISYEHFPTQTLLPPASAKVVRLDLKKEGSRIGYIRGAGDEIPAALRNMGYDVWEMNNDEITAENLKPLDAVVLGVRALNTNDRAPFFMPVVLDYVREGGTAVVQYNTSARLETDNFAPYPLTIGRDRVTDENSEVGILQPDHAVLNTPNKITVADFRGWVQERGLYFPSQWDDHYEAILSMSDKGESKKNSSLLVAKYGSGYYIYTGLSFFRELPEGVPGAYKLFANLVSLGKKAGQVSGSNKDRSR